MPDVRPTELLGCSFCGKSQRQARKIIAGPGVYICDQCIDLCNRVLQEELGERPAGDLNAEVEAAAEVARAAIDRLRSLAHRAEDPPDGAGAG